MVKKMLFYFLTVIAIASLVMICTAMTDTDENIVFLSEFGWETEKKYIEKENITIPEDFNEMYTEYNKLQQEAGFDLKEYRGKKAVRYTYIVKNYPDETDSEVRANVICVNGKPVGGDIMTVDLGGFMKPLNFLDTRD